MGWEILRVDLTSGNISEQSTTTRSRNLWRALAGAKICWTKSPPDWEPLTGNRLSYGHRPLQGPWPHLRRFMVLGKAPQTGRSNLSALGRGRTLRPRAEVGGYDAVHHPVQSPQTVYLWITDHKTGNPGCHPPVGSRYVPNPADDLEASRPQDPVWSRPGRRTKSVIACILTGHGRCFRAGRVRAGSWAPRT